MQSTQQKAVWMAEAIAEARRAWGQTHPNPLVGAIIIESGRIVARGYHARAGEPHAEIMALQNLGRPPAKDATLYVTLEPCSTAGKTGACTDALLQAGIQRLVVGAIDPNPQHAGRGIDILRQAGVQIEQGVLAERCTDLNLMFNHWMTTHTPFFAAKVATTLDGCVATQTGDSQWISGERARADVMHWRRYFPAIAVGSGTVLADNPRLTSRIGTEVKSPIRFIFDRKLKTVSEPLPNVFVDEFAQNTIVIATPDAPAEKLAKLEERAIHVWTLSAQDERRYFSAFKQKCIEKGIGGVYFETGSGLMRALLQARAVDYLFHYQAPKLLADAAAKRAFDGYAAPRLKDAITLRDVIRTPFDNDLLTRGYVHYAT